MAKREVTANIRKPSIFTYCLFLLALDGAICLKLVIKYRRRLLYFCNFCRISSQNTSNDLNSHMGRSDGHSFAAVDDVFDKLCLFSPA